MLRTSFTALASAFVLITSLQHVSGQEGGVDDLDGRSNAVVTTSVPFLTITPDSRSGGMADAGVALSPDANSTHWNASKLAFAEEGGLSYSYSPWLQNIINDMSLNYLSGYYRIDDLSAFGASFRYFSLGDITFTDEFGDFQGDHRPYEMAFDGSYSRMLSDNFSVGVGLRYVFSNLTGSGSMNGVETNPGQAIAGDISAFYTSEQEMFGYDGNLNFGLNISNLGNKVTYTEEIQSSFLPANLRFGSTAEVDVDDFNSVSLSLDINKLMVPTLPERDDDDNIVRGMDPDVGVMRGIFQSFYDAPGGFEESIREYMPSLGIEYWYNEQFAFRTGYFYEHPSKGNRQYVTMGLGLRHNILGFDFAYLVPTNQISAQTNPLRNTLRFSLSVKFDETGVIDRDNS